VGKQAIQAMPHERATASDTQGACRFVNKAIWGALRVRALAHVRRPRYVLRAGWRHGRAHVLRGSFSRVQQRKNDAVVCEFGQHVEGGQVRLFANQWLYGYRCIFVQPPRPAIVVDQNKPGGIT